MIHKTSPIKRENGLFHSMLFFLLFFCNFTTIAQTKNLVWREDFGVAGDSVRMDFADPKHTMPGHKCNLDTSQAVNDGTYAIMSSTAWAFSKNPQQRFFKLGRDHTGNKDGAMLVVNTDGRMVDKVIYEQTIDFPLCTANKYHFSMFAASITSFTCMQASLEIVILGNGSEIIAKKETGEIPWWESVKEEEKYADDPMTVRQWTEYGVDFESEGYKSITIQIVNRAKCTEDGRDPATLQEWEGCEAGNDFAIDDISLYRYDTDEVPEAEVSATTVTSQNKLSADCIYTSSYSIPTSTLESWKKIYPTVYFLWQVSEDGHTWSNMTEQSGVDKLDMETEADATKNLRYRVIITGGMTETEGKTVALQIAEKGGPDDGCYKYSISNTLAAAKLQADCSYRSDLKKIWAQDFGVMDSFDIKKFDGISPNMTFFDIANDNEFKSGQYVVGTAIDTAIYIPTSWNKYPENGAKGIAKFANDAYLYMRFGKASTTESANILVDKAISGPFCNCKSFIFSFAACNPDDEWKSTSIQARIVDDAGAILGEETFKFQGTKKSKAWLQKSIAFDIEKNYKGNIHLQLINTNSDEYNRLAIDNLEVLVCGDILPEAIVGIDNSKLNYLTGFDCNETPYHTFGSLNNSEWEHQFPEFGCAWQYTNDGGETWQYYATGTSHEYDNGEGGLIEYRAIFAETEAIAKEIAQNGKPSDPCNAYAFSNTIGFNCKVTGCKAPIFAFVNQESIDICDDSSDKVTLSVEKKGSTNVDSYQWFSSPAGKGTWNLEDWTTTSVDVLPAESTDYLFIAVNDTCYSDSIFTHINVHKAISLEKIEDTTVCKKSGLKLEAKVLSGEPTQYIWNGVSGILEELSFREINKKQTVTLQATDGVCSSEEMTIIIEVEDSVHIDLNIDKNEVCLGEEITLTTSIDEDDEYKTFALVKSEYGSLTKMTLAPSISEAPENQTTYTLQGTSKHCPSKELSVEVAINEIPTAPSGTLRVDYLMSDAEGGAFKNLLAQNPKAVDIEDGFTYTWYDAQENVIGATAPTPDAPAADNTEDINYTFYIGRESDKGCIGPKAKVVVNIFSAPTPSTQDVVYCLNEEAKPLTAQITVTEGAQTEDYNLIWYTTKVGDTALDEVPTPNTETAGETTYYVSQKNKTTQAESGRAPLTVTVYKVDKPIIGENKTSYCKEEETIPLVASTSDANCNLTWTLNGEKTSANSINTYVNSTTTYTYKVYQTLTIGEDHVCYGQEDAIEVTVTSVNEPTGTFNVSYTRLEAENNGNRFANNLLSQNENVAQAEDGHTLLWYDENKAFIGETAPTPTYDPTWETGKNIEFTFYVAQRDDKSLCIGEMKKVTVSINDAPQPNVESLFYCANSQTTEAQLKNDLKNAASINVLPNGEPLSHYRLVWFTSESEYLTNEGAGSNEPIVLPNLEQVGDQHFYVCQKNTITEAISTPAIITVTVYGLPSITTQPIESVCRYDGEEVTINLETGLDHTNDPIDYVAEFFANGALTESTAATVNTAGTYYIQGYYTAREDLRCYSEPQRLSVKIQDFTTPVITADEVVCPNMPVTLSATATSSNTDEMIQYTWSCDKTGVISTNNNSQITTENLSENFGDSYQFSVTAVSGLCQKESAPHTVTIGNAPLEGTLIISENGVDEPIGQITQATGNEFYSCGGELSFKTNFTKTTGDYLWSNGEVGALVSDNPTSGDKTYTLSFTNKCPTSVEFTIHTIPVTLKNELENYEGCEGEGFSRTLDIDCQENTYNVTWTKPNGIQTSGIGNLATTLAIDQTQLTDGGIYEYEVTNRACSIKGSFEAKIKQSVKFETEVLVILERGRDTTLHISFPDGKPTLVEWKENGTTVNLEESYTVRSIANDHTYSIEMSDPKYCDTKTTIAILMDASLMMTTHLKDSICAGESATLVVDTTGTGACRDITKSCKLTITENIAGVAKEITHQARIENGIFYLEVSPTADATYSAVLTYGDKRIERSNNIVVLEPIIIRAIPQPKVCGDESVTFEIAVTPADAIIEWDDDESITSGIYGNTLTVAPSFSSGSNHTEMRAYNFTASYAFCTPKSGTVNVRVDEPLRNGEINGDNVICIGNSANISASSFQAETYQWNDADSSRSASIHIQPDTTTTYSVSMTRGECKAEAEFTVKVASLPVIASVDSIGIRSRLIQVESGTGTQPFNYWVDNKESSTFARIDDLLFTKHTAYVEDAYGCRAEMEFKVFPPELTFKTYFTPNADGINDTWEITSLQELYPDATIKIFDRTGKLIYEGKAAEGSWDGTYNGKTMPSTDYWYEVNIQELKKLYTGHFTLIRSN